MYSYEEMTVLYKKLKIIERGNKTIVSQNMELHQENERMMNELKYLRHTIPPSLPTPLIYGLLGSNLLSAGLLIYAIFF